jgi:hypothetical protein
MKRTKIFLSVAALLCAVAIFTGCPTESGDDTNYGSGDERELTITVSGTSSANDGPKYYSLTTGTQITDAAAIASQAWDIAVAKSRMIYTNSGATATSEGSGGKGGIWFTNKTDFGDVSDEDEVETTGEYAEYADFTTDVVKYTSATASSRFNVMTYWGFAGGTGTAEDPYTTKSPPSVPPPADFVPYTYDKKNYISMTSMTGPTGATYELSNQVYIIKHGDGTQYSKLQVTEYTSVSTGGSGMTATSDETYKIKYRNF